MSYSSSSKAKMSYSLPFSATRNAWAKSKLTPRQKMAHILNLHRPRAQQRPFACEGLRFLIGRRPGYTGFKGCRTLLCSRGAAGWTGIARGLFEGLHITRTWQLNRFEGISSSLLVIRPFLCMKRQVYKFSNWCWIG